MAALNSGFRLCRIVAVQSDTCSGVPRGDAQDARATPLPPLCIPPPGHVHPPPSLKGWLWEKMRQWEQEKNASLYTCDLFFRKTILTKGKKGSIQQQILEP